VPLQFQLTVNFSALVVVFFGSVISGILPLNVLQLLWWVLGSWLVLVFLLPGALRLGILMSASWLASQ
jgi:hypothetical protein